jgi:hypothetical protein
VVTPYSDEEEDQDNDSETSNIPLIQTSDNNDEFTDIKQPYEIYIHKKIILKSLKVSFSKSGIGNLGELIKNISLLQSYHKSLNFHM